MNIALVVCGMNAKREQPPDLPALQRLRVERQQLEKLVAVGIEQPEHPDEQLINGDDPQQPRDGPAAATVLDSIKQRHSETLAEGGRGFNRGKNSVGRAHGRDGHATGPACEFTPFGRST